MGNWGPGLYSNDFALDLRSMIAALARLPLGACQIFEIVHSSEQQVAEDPGDSDHTTFWLVTADQFQKRGLEYAEATAKAIALIDSCADKTSLQSLGMPAPALGKRSAIVAALRERLKRGAIPTRCTTLKKPQAMIMAVGDVLSYPTSHGEPFNPYFRPGDGLYKWAQDAWGAMLVVDAGLAFGYLAWYTAMICKYEFDDRPSIASLMRSPWTLAGSGTCSPTHFRRMALEPVDKVVIIKEKIEAAFGKLRPALSEAVSDVSISDRLDVVSKNPVGLRLIQPSMERKRSLELREFATASPR